MKAFDKIRRLYQLDESKNYGFSEEDIRQLEIRNNSKLPEVLRAYYQTLGKQADLNNSFNRLLNPTDEAVFVADRHFVFYEENQGVISWAISEADFVSDNPTVYANADAVNLTYPWYAESLTTDDFLLYMAIWNGVLGGLKYNANTLDESSLPEKLLELIERKWTEINGLTYQAQRIFTDDFNEVISMSVNEQNRPSGIVIGTNDKSRFLRMIDDLGITFDYWSDEDEEENDDELNTEKP